MRNLIDARCRNCGRLLFKFGLGTFGTVEIKCSHASDCKAINLFHLDARGAHQGLRHHAMAST